MQSKGVAMRSSEDVKIEGVPIVVYFDACDGEVLPYRIETQNGIDDILPLLSDDMIERIVEEIHRLATKRAHDDYLDHMYEESWRDAA